MGFNKTIIICDITLAKPCAQGFTLVSHLMFKTLFGAEIVTLGVARLGKHLTPDFSSDHDLEVREFKP